MRKLTIVALLAILVSLVALGGGVAQAKGKGCDVTVTPGQSIQDAIDASSEGDTVCVKAGIYQENVDVNKKDLVLRGEGRRQPTVDATNSGSAIKVTADGVTVKNFRVTNGLGSGGVAGIRRRRRVPKCALAEQSVADDRRIDGSFS